MSTDNSTVPAKPSSPDELNRLLKITRPYHWVAISAIGALTLFAILWSIFGSIPQRINGIGEITTHKGLHGIVARYPGQVIAVFFSLGDTVREGQVIARLSQPQLTEQLDELYNQRDILEGQSIYLKSGNTTSRRIKTQSVEAQLQRLKKNLEQADKKIAFLEERLKEQEQLYKDGLITYTQYFQTKDQLFQSKADRSKINEDLLSVELGNDEWKLQNDMKEKDLGGQVASLNKKIEELEREYELQTEVRATASGVVTDIDIRSGDMVASGESLFTIEEFNNEDYRKLELFIPFNANAPVRPGMEVQIEPFTVDHNVYGWLIGEVVGVNHYVSSQQSIQDQINSPDLVGLITRNGPVYRVEVKLKMDPKTISGYAFSNKSGPPFKIQTGTLCNAYVEVKKKAPIDYLIPIFKEYFE